MSHAEGLYSVEQVRAFDAHAIRVHGIAGFTLMTRAGEAALLALRKHWPDVRRIAIVCGTGNNGGDGYVLGERARAAGLEAVVLPLVDPASLQGDARIAADRYRAAGGRLQPFAPNALAGAELLVDALLGTGLREPPRAHFAAAIEAMNTAGLPILALDLPSGLDGDNGRAPGVAVRATATVTFVGRKLGLYLADGPDLAGRIFFSDLGVELPVGAGSQPVLELLVRGELARTLPPRTRAAHKGEFGRVLIIGGGPGMAGAARLAGTAALRCGAGIVTVATTPENVAPIVAGRPELIVQAARDARDLAPLLSMASVVAIGPGLGTGAWSRTMLDAALEGAKPLVLDADALNLLAEAGQRPPPLAVLTPHPGEAARLLHTSAAGVQSDRAAALGRLVGETGAVVVLKGAGTLVGAPGRVPALCADGNPGMAAPGMGDVLTGAIAAMLAQCKDPWLAARAGVLAHALAGDEVAARGGGRGMLALEVADALRLGVNP
jgi:ADP-dependent NAD(P)H-hydrate dehydratase / NAD(P)H-hydrate epimerase